MLGAPFSMTCQHVFVSSSRKYTSETLPDGSMRLSSKLAQLSWSTSCSVHPRWLASSFLESRIALAPSTKVSCADVLPTVALSAVLFFEVSISSEPLLHTAEYELSPM
jgi:hypothetical protein